ncbi:MAG: lipopolysaccharide heptosyltransferase I [Campylobacterota bacterium]|nr:lipopolysaccharide heptosyltransferase I [Campylobacterota bacterium]
MKIAIVKLSATGDIVHGAIALQFIKKHYPDAKIDWVCENAFKGVLEGNKEINAIHTINLKEIKKNRDLRAFIGLIKKLRSLGSYDVIIDMQGLIKSSIVSRLIGKNTFGFDANSTRESQASFFYKESFDIAYHENTIDRNINVIAKALDFEVTHDEALNKEAFLFYEGSDFAFDPFMKEQNVVFIVGSTWPSRNYPKELFADLATKLHVNCLIAWGNDEEREAAEYIAQHSEYATVLPKLNLNALKALIAKSDLLIGNDTGPTHMAWAMNRPSITIFGPTPISRVHVTEINKVVKSPSVVDPYKLNKEDFSIKDISVEEIVNLAQKLLYKE